MDSLLILGDGALGRAVETAFRGRCTPGGTTPAIRLIGRPATGRHDPADFADAGARVASVGSRAGAPAAISGVVVEASRGDAVAANLAAALEAGYRHAVIATTSWSDDRPKVEALLHEYGASAVAASNFSLGVVLFGRLVDAAVGLFGSLDAFDPYLVEWHRRSKRDRPSGTAGDLSRRIVAAHPRLASPDDLEVVSIRAGASPGMHLVGFDAAGETIELRLTARDRSPYAAGILAAIDWLETARRAPGIHSFDLIVDELIARDRIAA